MNRTTPLDTRLARIEGTLQRLETDIFQIKMRIMGIFCSQCGDFIRLLDQREKFPKKEMCKECKQPSILVNVFEGSDGETSEDEVD